MDLNEKIERLFEITQNVMDFKEGLLCADNVGKLGVTIIFMLIKSEGGGIGMSEITERLKMTKSAVSQKISRLEKMGIVKRKWAKTDRRKIMVFITDKGRAAARGTREIIFDFFEERFKNMDGDEAELLIKLAGKFLSAENDKH